MSDTEINEEKLNALLGQMVSDMGAAAVGPLCLLGRELGLYRALAAEGPMNTPALAVKTGCNERYTREWCAAQAASGYINHDGGQFSMSPEQAAVFADDDSPACMTSGYYSIRSLYIDLPKMTAAFKTGEGVGWGEHDECLFFGTEKFFAAAYEANLVSQWLPSLDGVVAKLEAGGKVADVGCGHGASTIIMAKAFPKSSFVGFDLHKESVANANANKEKSGLDNVRFEVANADAFPGSDYDLVAFFDCLHDMGDPVGASKRTHAALKPDGTLMIVEPFAGDKLTDNLNPVGRLFYSFSTMCCVPASMSQDVGLALGAQAGEERLSDVVKRGGFASVKRATETPFNLILEARP